MNKVTRCREMADYRRHLLDCGYSEPDMEKMIGEGWTYFSIYQAEYEGGNVPSINTAEYRP